MRAHALFQEYIWIINTIIKAKRISLKEINAKWLDTEMSEGVEFSRRTFIRHKIAIEEMFGVIIDCDSKDEYRYYIGNPEVLRSNSIQNWMLSTLSVNSIVSDSLSLQDRILVESDMVSHDYLNTIISAMKSKRKVTISYLKYGETAEKEVLVEPYCLKMFKQRWYVLSHFDGDVFKTYSLDRIKSASVSQERFEMDPSFDAESFFDEYFGILRIDTVKCERVILRAFGKERYYLRDLPIHHSQKEISRANDYSDFSYQIHPTPDFQNHILSRAGQVKVLEPKWLAEKIKEMAMNVARLYE